MKMTNYFPTYIKRNSTLPAWAADPACFLYLPLYSLQGASFKSLDRFGYSITNTGGAIGGTPVGMYFDGSNDQLAWLNLATTTYTELTFITWFKNHATSWPTGTGAYRVVFSNFRRVTSPTTFRSGMQFGRCYDDGKFGFRLFDGVSDATNYQCLFLTSLLSLNAFHFTVGRYKTGSLLEVYLNNVRKNYNTSANIPSQVVSVKGDTNNVCLTSTYYSNFTVGMVAVYSRCLSLSEISQIYADTKDRYL